MFNIIYLCPKSSTAIGGVKVIYKNSEYFKNKYSNSQIYHPEDENFQCTWFEHEAQIRPHGAFNPSTDFLIIPEFWAAWFSKQAVANNIRYAIYVQNGYFLYQKPGLTAMTDDDLFNAYHKADLIVSISDDTTRMIKLAFPEIDHHKIVRVKPHVADKFIQSTPKQKTITYMPRKLAPHAERVIFFLKRNIFPDWTILPIDGKSEDDVVKILSSSSIFLSFCEMEGCPLPPLEAAFSGNIVVGYTGQGAKEYFSEPIFHEIGMGDFENFTKKILLIIDQIESRRKHDSFLIDQKKLLIQNYSSNASNLTLEDLYKIISQIMKK
jgi:hypothetical protein